jgi:hypothetical protein
LRGEVGRGEKEGSKEKRRRIRLEEDAVERSIERRGKGGREERRTELI